MYLNESQVRAAAKRDSRIAARTKDAFGILKESVETASSHEQFDVFLCHAIRDAELVLGAKKILEAQMLKVYVDWVVDPMMDRSNVTADTAGKLRTRMKQSSSLLYLYSNNSTRSRWMPWELGYFDGAKGTVAVLPIVPDSGKLDFSTEEYLQLYPKVEFQDVGIFVNRTKDVPVAANDSKNYRTFQTWLSDPEELRM